MDWTRLFAAADQEYRGSRVSFCFLVLVAVVVTFRGLVHMLAADGGAQSIGGLNLAVEGGANIVAVFGQRGASQLTLTLLHWLTVVRYRFLVPSDAAHSGPGTVASDSRGALEAAADRDSAAGSLRELRAAPALSHSIPAIAAPKREGGLASLWLRMVPAAPVEHSQADLWC